MKRCITCLYPDTKPDLFFNEEGECSACVSSKEKKVIDWEGRKTELMQLLDEFHGEVIVPSSGGKDSTFQAITLKEMGAHVTAVTARTCHLTKLGRENIDNLSRHVRTIEYVPNMSVRAKLNKLGLTMGGDISWPEHVSIFTTPFRAAMELGKGLIMYGECPQREYGGPQGSDQAKQMTARWVSEFGGFLGLRPQDLVGLEGITSKDMDDYLLPKEAKGIEAHFLGQYLPWDSHHNAKVAINAGMKYSLPSNANWWEAENLDNAQTGLHDYMGYLKYGYGRATAQLSVDIRNGIITRKDALEIAESHDPIFPEEYGGVWLGEILDRINVTREELMRILDKYTNKAIFPCLQKE